MREHVLSQLGQRRRRAAVFGVAGAAGQRGTLLRDHAVQFCHVKHLRGDVGMAGRAAVGHHGGIPGRAVTGRALGDLRMGGYAAERRTRLGIQVSRCEHGTAAQKGHADNRDQSEERGKDARTGETARFMIHDGLLFEERGVI